MTAPARERLLNLLDVLEQAAARKSVYRERVECATSPVAQQSCLAAMGEEIEKIGKARLAIVSLFDAQGIHEAAP